MKKEEIIIDNTTGFVKGSYRLGSFIIKALWLQLLTVCYTLKGCLLLGLFPSITTSFRLVHQNFKEDLTAKELRQKFKHYYQETFKESNQVGYILTVLGLFLVIDLKVSSIYIQSVMLHMLLLVFFIGYLGVCLFIFPVIARYQLTTQQYLKQAFLLFLASPVETIAIVIALSLLGIIWTACPILLFIASIPMVTGVILWFSKQGILRSERKHLSNE
ncbi:YesL family protein [Vagococcus humatus]|uniref:DUF624 domain-containing protein n=1 Tax=Vagococcus humatus TaxID=1889241 RepID=A0A3R9YJ07_9ENTE|nr:DUF624 domain-containing protein [Vagococcus humatus]RST88848.1 hypothetical protein C7P63_08485 [Vagococcus humatus]